MTNSPIQYTHFVLFQTPQFDTYIHSTIDINILKIKKALEEEKNKKKHEQIKLTGYGHKNC